MTAGFAVPSLPPATPYSSIFELPIRHVQRTRIAMVGLQYNVRGEPLFTFSSWLHARQCQGLAASKARVLQRVARVFLRRCGITTLYCQALVLAFEGGTFYGMQDPNHHFPKLPPLSGGPGN